MEYPDAAFRPDDQYILKRRSSNDGKFIWDLWDVNGPIACGLELHELDLRIHFLEEDREKTRAANSRGRRWFF